MTITRVIFTWIFLIPLISWSQVNDAGLWTALSLSKDVEAVDDLSASFEVQTRFNENWAELGTAFAEFGLDYKIISQLRVGADYRFGNRRGLDNLYTLRHRVNFDLMLREKWSGYTCSYRARYQIGQRNLQSEERIGERSHAIRHKLSVEKKVIKRTFLNLSGELFTQRQDQITILTDWRVTAMLERRIKKRRYFNFGYTVQQEQNAVNPGTEYILRLSYKIELK